MNKVLIKLSGESLSGNKENEFYDKSVLGFISDCVMELSKENNIVIVVGGGNIVRGHTLSGDLNITQSTADYVGMLATVQNALVLRDFFHSKKISCNVVSSINMPQICDEYVPFKVIDSLENGNVVIFAAGLGAPYFTTDTSAVRRAVELGIKNILFVKNGVDGLYDDDPDINKNAKKVIEITATDFLKHNLKALDQTAILISRENKISLKIIGLDDLNKMNSENVGSIIKPI